MNIFLYFANDFLIDFKLCSRDYNFDIDFNSNKFVKHSLTQKFEIDVVQVEHLNNIVKLILIQLWFKNIVLKSHVVIKNIVDINN